MTDPDADISKDAFESMKNMIKDPSKRAILVQDKTCMGGLVLVLGNPDKNIIKCSLEILLMLSEYPEHRYALKNFLGLVDQLQTLFTHDDFEVRELSKLIYGYISQEAEPVEQTHQQSLNNRQVSVTKKEGRNKKRRNSFFVGGGLVKNKVVVLQIRGLNDKDDVDTCRNCLLTVKGVISIIIDFKKKRATLRTVPELKPELLAKAISKTMTMVAEQVIKDEHGNEVLIPFGTTISADTQEKTNMPDYPEEELFTVKGDKNLARFGDSSKSKNGWSFVESVGNFLSNSFYW